MWSERLKRILLVVAAGVFLMLAGKVLADWRTTKAVKGESVELPIQLVVDKLEEVSQNVLGKAVEKETQTTQTAATETTKIIETQTKEMIEIIKQLPQSQLDQIKKQIFKDFCREVLGE